MDEAQEDVLIEGFADALEDDQCETLTVDSYVRLARRAGLDPVGWLKATIHKKTPRNSAGVYLAAMKRWADYLNTQGIDADLSTYKKPKLLIAQQLYRDALSPAKLKAYRQAIGGVAEPSRTILLLLPLTALRIAEACALPREPREVLGGNLGLRVLGKRGKTRWVPLLPQADFLIDAYESARPFREDQDEAFLFPGHGGRSSFSPSAVRRHLRRVRASAGLHDVTPHTLRHTAASMLHDAGASERVLQEILGHASIQTTLRYIHPSPTAIAKAMSLLTEKE